MKKILLLFCIVILSCVVSCVKKGTIVENTNNIKIVTTIFPIYDLTKEIVSDVSDIDVTLLMQSGVDLHNFNPSAKDLIDISNADLFIYIGGESDDWVTDVKKSFNGKNINEINLMEALKDKVLKEDEDEFEVEEEAHEEEYDEHIWLSLKNAKQIINAIENKLENIDEKNKLKYKSNAIELINNINNLDDKYKNIMDNKGNAMVVFADRFPFKYLFNDYGIKYIAAFKGCSTESEASFEKILTLANAVDEYNLHNVMILEGGNEKIAKTVIENCKNKDVKILTLDSMQSTTSEDIKMGKNYISIMNDNFLNLTEALK